MSSLVVLKIETWQSLGFHVSTVSHENCDGSGVTSVIIQRLINEDMSSKANIYTARRNMKVKLLYRTNLLCIAIKNICVAPVKALDG